MIKLGDYLKILILGSSGIHIIRWAEFFLKKGHEVVFVIGFNYSNDKMKIYRFDKKYGLLSFFTTLLKLKKIIKNEKPDVLYTQYLTTYGILAAMTGFKNLVLSIIGSDIYTHIKKFPFGILVKIFINKYKMINLECDGVVNRTLKYFKYPSRITVKNWGVDFSLFNPHLDVASLREKYNLGLHEKVIVSGRVPIARCNVETIVRAFKEIYDRRSDARLFILGEGESIPKLKQIVDSLGISDKVIFTGFIPHDEFGKYLKLADVYVQTSLVDTVSVTLLDAMACKVPCISSNVGCNNEFLKHEFNGLLLENPMDYKQLAKHIERVLDDSDLREKFVERSYEMVINKCDESKNMAYIEGEIKRLVLSE